MQDSVKMAERGCTRDSDVIVYEWAPGLKRCPKSQLTPDVWERILWWDDWKMLGCLPWPGNDLNTQPAIVYDVLRLCESEHQKASSEVKRDG